MIREFERAVLIRDLPEKGLKAGDLGTVVDVYGGEGGEAAGYSLEFFTLDGETLAVATVMADAVRAVGAKDVAHVRTL